VRHDAEMPDEIAEATTDEDYAAFGALIREYWEWLQSRYADVPGLVDNVGGYQALDAELMSLPATYGPPKGRTLLARRDGEVVGGVALKDLGDGSCEMKRLFVPERFHGGGTGRRLCGALLDMAVADGYRLMRLDTGSHNTEALAMYESLGFREGPSYHDYPAELVPHLRFLERPLATV
jgi:ribosomal protein S18 acetylase RimI-like enzyme